MVGTLVIPVSLCILSTYYRLLQTCVAVEEIKHHSDIMDGSLRQISQLFNTVFLAIFTWTKKMKQLGISNLVMTSEQVNWRTDKSSIHL